MMERSNLFKCFTLSTFASLTFPSAAIVPKMGFIPSCPSMPIENKTNKKWCKNILQKGWRNMTIGMTTLENIYMSLLQI